DFSWRLVLWTVSPAGEKPSETPLEIPGRTLRDPQIRGLVLLDGGALLAAELEPGQLALLKAAQDGGGSVLWHSAVPLSINKLVSVKDAVVLLGIRAQDAYLAKISLAGKLLWEKVVDRGQVDEFTDALPTDDGGVVVVGHSWSGALYHTGASTV